jgi:hypothetical protein
MIPYDELDRALARWKARAQGSQDQSQRTVLGGMIDAAAAVAPEMLGEATPMPISADELGSIPNVANVPERTGEIDVGELEAYEEGEEEV